MTIDRLISALIMLTLVEMMASIGLGVKFSDIGGIARNRGLLVRAALANYVCVPAVTVGLLLWFHPSPLVAAGFLIVAVCPGAPFGPPLTGVARGNVAVSVGLMAILAASSAIAAPLLLRFLLPLIAGNQPLKVDAAKIAGTLLGSQLLPLCAGMFVLQLRPALADRLKQPFARASTVLILIAFGLILVVRFQMLAAIKFKGIIGMLVLTIASMAAGWLLGEPGSENRKAMCFSTAIRNVAVSLVIVTSSFPDTPAVTAAVAFGLFQSALLAIVAAGWGRLEAA